jgi:Nif-specific regulatory protein
VRRTHRLPAVIDVSQALSATLNLNTALRRVLGVMTNHHGIVSGLIVLVRDGELHVEAAEGFAQDYRETRVPPGDSVVRRVVETGMPVVVARASGEPALTGWPRRNARSGDLSLVGVPVVQQRAVIGALAFDLRFKPARDFTSSVKLFGIVGSMIAQAINVHRLVEEERRRLMDENVHLRHALGGGREVSAIVGTSGPTREISEQVAQVARTNTTVLIRGESGTGKELVAHAIHNSSSRAKKAFVKVSCAALPEGLIESELFGHEKGAFTGAQARKKGRFELAEGGTLFLDEIGEINLKTQIKLLRVLQEREFERLGGTETIRADVRIIAATNRNLEQAIADGAFREELYYRLDVFTLFVPPLRDRKGDLLLLADHFLEKFAREHRKTIKRISTPAIDMLMAYHWPGNVRELENALERAVLACTGPVVHSHHLPPSLQTADASGTVTRLSLKDAITAYERDLIFDVLKTAHGNCSKAARLLDTTTRIFNHKLRKYAIDVRRFKSPRASWPRQTDALPELAEMRAGGIDL